MLGVVYLPRPPEPGPVGTRSLSFQGRSFNRQRTLLLCERPEHPNHHPTGSSRGVDAVSNRHQVPTITPHDLRHTAASLAVSAGLASVVKFHWNGNGVELIGNTG
jgi:integrase